MSRSKANFSIPPAVSLSARSSQTTPDPKGQTVSDAPVVVTATDGRAPQSPFAALEDRVAELERFVVKVAVSSFAEIHTRLSILEGDNRALRARVAKLESSAEEFDDRLDTYRRNAILEPKP